MERIRHDKRAYEHSSVEDSGGDCINIDDNDHYSPESKKRKLPALASVIVDALKVDSLQRLCSSLEPMLRRIVSEEVERALTKMGHASLPGRPQPRRITGTPEGKALQLQFKTKMPPHIFTGARVEGERGSPIHVALVDAATGAIVSAGPNSAAKLTVVVLEGDFNEDADDDDVAEFEGQEVREREGKRPLLAGDLHVALKQGIGTLGDVSFTDNSSWIRSRKFRLGLKVSPGWSCDGVRVREAKTEPFAVKDHRGELYKKHYPPALQDEVWRLDRIAKDGALHKKLIKSDILTVQDFLRLLVKDPQRLRSMLGSGMSNRMWDNTVEHAKTCVLGGKLYVYYTDKTLSTAVVFNHIYELRGLIADGQFHSLDSLSHAQKVSVDLIVKRAYENWHEVVEYDGKVLTTTTAATRKANNHFHFEAAGAAPAAMTSSTMMMPVQAEYYESTGVGFSYFSGDWSRPRGGEGLEDVVAEEIRVRSSEMLEADDDMQRLLRSFGVGVGSCSSGQACYTTATATAVRFEQPARPGGGSGRAVVGWLKLKAALRWGIFVRRRAAERRAQLTELD